MYTCARDLEFRLKGTLVWVNGKHCYVKGTMFDGKDKQYIVTRDGNFDIKNQDVRVSRIPTGYVNHRGKALFLKRKANRTYRQGLRVDNSTLLGAEPWAMEEYINDVRRGEDYNLEEGMVILNKDFAVIDGSLNYRGAVVGVVVDGQYYLDNENYFLREYLNEVLELGDKHEP